MGWYQCVKTVKGHKYLYLQMSYREGGKVKTKSKYLGPVSGGFGKSTVANLPVAEGSPKDEKPAGGLKIDKIRRAKHLKNPRLLPHEIEYLKAHKYIMGEGHRRLIRSEAKWRKHANVGILGRLLGRGKIQRGMANSMRRTITMEEKRYDALRSRMIKE